MNISEILKTWRSANAFLQSASEQDCLALLQYEQQNEDRYPMLIRVYHRFAKMRTQRERAEILSAHKSRQCR